MYVALRYTLSRFEVVGDSTALSSVEIVLYTQYTANALTGVCKSDRSKSPVLEWFNNAAIRSLKL